MGNPTAGSSPMEGVLDNMVLEQPPACHTHSDTNSPVANHGFSTYNPAGEGGQTNCSPPPVKVQPTTTSNKGNPLATTTPQCDNVWAKNESTGLSYADQIRNNKESNETRLEYFPPTITPEGKYRVILTKEDLMASAKTFSLHLYGYFLGTSMDYNRVNTCLKHLWQSYDLAEISKSSAGFYYFKFNSEVGLQGVLENGPWMVNNIPIFLNKWEPGLCLEKIEPSTIHLWVTVHNVPLELWTVTGMGKIFSRVGYPLLLDKVTKDRVLGTSGKLGYARMLVEAKAASGLPNEVEIEFPLGSNRAARVGTLPVSYQWKPAVCSHCNVFGHSLNSCKLRPKTAEEMETSGAKPNSTQPAVDETVELANDNDGFIPISRKKRNGKVGGKGKQDVHQGNKKPPKVNFVRPGSSSKGVYPAKGTPPVNQSNNEHAPMPGDSSGMKKVTKGFNFTRAVQGPNSVPKAVPKLSSNRFSVLSENVSSPAPSGDPHPNAGTNFSVMDFEASLKSNKLVGDHMELFIPDASGIDVLAQKIDNVPSTLTPATVTSSGANDNPMVTTVAKEKDYDITNAQRRAIRSCLVKGKGIRAEVTQEWSSGEWEYFGDQCDILGLDPDFIIEDVGQDTSGTAQFFSQFMKEGSRYDPVVSKPSPKKG